MTRHPAQRIFSVDSESTADINTFVELCYKAAGAELEKLFVPPEYNQRDYFPFYDYEYVLDVSAMKELLPVQKDLFEGFEESYKWYAGHKQDIAKKEYIKFIDENIAAALHAV